jgi:Ni/Fe-hydrogenase subunit HybB-like protein
MSDVALPVGPATPSPTRHAEEPARAIGGPIRTGAFWILAAIAGAGAVALAVRFAAGLGAVTALNDGYPWGMWIAFDVVIGTALGCGGYALAILVYVLNRGRYHPLVRPAVLTSALGYTMAATSVVIDVGRWWNLWKIPTHPHLWNLNSALLEVALCVMTYLVVLWIELVPAACERYRDDDSGLGRLARVLGPPLERALPWILALGLLLPTMHQSSLGSVAMLFVTKLHPLWHTPLLPGLFLLSVVAMGYAVVVLESHLSASAFGLPRETRLLGSLGRVAAWLTIAFLAIRVADLGYRGRLALAFVPDRHAAFFLLEVVLFAVPAALLLGRKGRTDPGRQLLSGVLLLVAGGLYRFDAYLIAFDPGHGYRYFPSVGELLVSAGIVAAEVLLYVVIVKTFPILRGAAAPGAKG